MHPLLKNVASLFIFTNDVTQRELRELDQLMAD